MYYQEIVATAWDCIDPSHKRGESAQCYVRGHDVSGPIEPHYSVPAIPTRVRWEDTFNSETTNEYHLYITERYSTTSEYGGGTSAYFKVIRVLHAWIKNGRKGCWIGRTNHYR